MAFRVALSPKAIDDLDSIIEFFYDINSSLAEEIYDGLFSRIQSLEELCERGRRVPELVDEGIFKYRELIEGNYRIIYRVHKSEVEIVTIVDSRRLFDLKIE